jgi:hypothetical protein
VVAGALHENCHLVRHQSDVSLRPGKHGKAGALPGRRNEEETRRHLDDGLPDRAAAEMPPGAARKGLESRGQSGQVLRVRLVKAARGAERQSVLRQEYRLLDVRDSKHKII